MERLASMCSIYLTIYWSEIKSALWNIFFSNLSLRVINQSIGIIVIYTEKRSIWRGYKNSKPTMNNEQTLNCREDGHVFIYQFWMLKIIT